MSIRMNGCLLPTSIWINAVIFLLELLIVIQKKKMMFIDCRH